jgi:hypothetical protein
MRNIVARTFLLLSLPSLMAFTEILSTKKSHYELEAGGEFNLTVYKKRFRLSRHEPMIFANHMTDIRAALVLEGPMDFKKYGVVQYIKGCKWRSTWNGKALTKELSIARDHLNQRVVFRHPGFEVDTVDLDPMYSGYEGNRFALWRWNENKRSDDPETATYVFHRDPPHGTVFVTDMPGTSFRSEAEYNNVITAQNSTLEFKTCLFKIEDIPLETDAQGSNIFLDKALKCFEWEDKWIYDFPSEKMTSPKVIDPICL